MSRGAFALHSATYFGLSYNAIGYTPVDGRQTLVAAVFAALGLEAFLNELLHLAEYDGHVPINQELAANLRGSGRFPLSPMRRIEIVGRMFPDSADCEDWPGAARDARLLFELRNGLAHYKVELHSWEVEDEPYVAPGEPLLTQLHERGLIDDPSARDILPWIDMIQTRAVAIWAYNTAVRMMHELFRRLPEGVLALKLLFAVERIPMLRVEP